MFGGHIFTSEAPWLLDISRGGQQGCPHHHTIRTEAELASSSPLFSLTHLLFGIDVSEMLNMIFA